MAKRKMKSLSHGLSILQLSLKLEQLQDFSNKSTINSH